MRLQCQLLGLNRSSLYYQPAREAAENQRLMRLIDQEYTAHPFSGSRKLTRWLVQQGEAVNRKRVHRLWRREGLKVPQVQRKRRRLGSSGNGCTRRRAERPNHVWSYDFVMDRTADGRRLKVLPVVDEFTRECLTIEVERGMDAEAVVSTLEYLFELRGEPEHIRSDNGPEFIAEAVRSWLARRGSKTLYIEPGSPWENAYSESFNSRLRDESLDREVFETLKEAKVIIEDHRLESNHGRLHSSLRYRTPAEFAAACVRPGSDSLPPADVVPVPDPVLS